MCMLYASTQVRLVIGHSCSITLCTTSSVLRSLASCLMRKVHAQERPRHCSGVVIGYSLNPTLDIISIKLVHPDHSVCPDHGYSTKGCTERCFRSNLGLSLQHTRPHAHARECDRWVAVVLTRRTTPRPSAPLHARIRMHLSTSIAIRVRLDTIHAHVRCQRRRYRSLQLRCRWQHKKCCSASYCQWQ